MKFTKSFSVGSDQKTNMKDSLREAAADMAEHTAMHGLPHLKHSRSLTKKIIWLLIVLAAFGFLFWQVTMLVIKYYSYPVTTKTEIVFKSAVKFPAITFCNLNPVRKSKVHMLPQAVQVLLNSNLSSRPARPGANDNSSTNPYIVDREDFAAKEDFYWQFLSINESLRKEVGHQIDDMLIDCTWDGCLCGPSNFTWFYNWQYGNCFTFNSGRSQPAITVRQPGPLKGLTLRIYAQSLEYVPFLSSALGIKMVIHNQTTMPFPDNEGFVVPTGSYTQVSVLTTFVSLQDPPYGTCRNFSRSEAVSINAYMDVLNSTEYTRQGCINTCKQKSIMKTCGCSSAMYANEGTAFRDINAAFKKHCASHNRTAITCQDNQDHVSMVECGEPIVCPDRCVDLQFYSKSTEATWPTDTEQTKTIADLMSLAVESNDKGLTHTLNSLSSSPTLQRTFVEENVMIMEVYLEDLSEVSYTTEASFGMEDFLASLGGCGGLWLGISVMTIFEICEFLINLCGMFCRREKNSPTVDTALGEKQ